MNRIRREDVEAWNSAWSHTDKMLVVQVLGLLPDGCEFFQAKDNGQLVVKHAGRRALVIRPGFVEWPGESEVPGLDLKLTADGALYTYESQGGGVGAVFSTFRPRGEAAAERHRDHGICPVHFIALPATRRCPDCDNP